MSDRPTIDEENDVPQEELSQQNEPPEQPAVDEAEAAETPTGQLTEADDRALRAQAELENFRKRTRREMEDQRRYAALPLLHDLLTVLDNLQRAIEASPPEDSKSSLLEGVKMVAAQLVDVLERHDCRQIESVGTMFDPNLHEALGQQPSDEHPSNTVLQEMQAGYLLHDRVIRPTRVFISSGPAQDLKEDSADE